MQEPIKRVNEKGEVKDLPFEEVPGGRYWSSAGTLVNGEGEPIREDGKLLNAPDDPREAEIAALRLQIEELTAAKTQQPENVEEVTPPAADPATLSIAEQKAADAAKAKAAKAEGTGS